MPAKYLIIILLFYTSFSFSQNLVPNGDFENYSLLPDMVAEWDRCIDVININGSNETTPDYLSTLGSNQAQLPNSVFATVYPYSGNAIMGIAVAYNDTTGIYLTNDYREYISFHLTHPMVTGINYHISFHITNGEANNYSGLSSNHLGVCFTENVLHQYGTGAISATPQFEIAGEVWSTTWQHIEFDFVADQPYEFITIGNFHDPSETSTSVHVPYTIPAAYYFFDKIEVIPDNINYLSACEGSALTLNSPYSDQNSWVLQSNPTTIIGTDDSLQIAQAVNQTYILYHLEDTIYYVVETESLQGLNLGNDVVKCPGVNHVFDAGNSFSSYLWSTGSVGSQIDVLQAGTYWLEVTNSCGSLFDTVVFSIAPVPVFDLGNDTAICSGSTIVFDVSYPGTTCIWQNGSTNPVFVVTEPGYYYANVQLGQCSVLDYISIAEETDCPTYNPGIQTALITMPNVFTPDNNNVNDKFTPTIYQNIEMAKLIVLNRWGETVFESSNLSLGWDGVSNGKNCTEGVYFWIVTYIDKTGKEGRLEGNVTLVR